MAHGGINKWTPPRKSGGIPRVSTRFSLGVENEQADSGRDGRTDYWQPYPVDPYSAICDNHAARRTLKILNPKLKSYYGNDTTIPVLCVLSCMSLLLL